MRPIPDYGDVFTVKDFYDCVDSGLFNDYDGFGKYATEKEISDEVVDLSDVKVNTEYTHVVWFNK